MLLSLIRHRELILRLVKRDLKVRYKSSVLGFLWSVAKPLLLVAIYTFAFDTLLNLKLPAPEIPFSMHMMAGLLPWVYFSAAVGESIHVILANASLIKKIRLPNEVFPVATVLSNLGHFLLALPVLFGFMAWKGIFLTWQAVWLVPLILLQTALAVALALLLSALTVYYRDVASACEVIFTAWFYATPIIYPISLVAQVFGLAGPSAPAHPIWLLRVYFLNPMTPLVLAYRRVLLYACPLGPDKIVPAPEYASFAGAHPDLWLAGQLGVCVGVTAALFVLGAWVFRRYSRFFADEL